jgi:DNA-binding LytR/AlgR family response regulator
MTSIIVEEDASARASLRKLVATVDDLIITAEYSSAMEAYQDLLALQVDLILLDVDSPDETGLELARKLKSWDSLVVFIAARKQYAAEAFDLNVVDYLVKPVSPERFFQAIFKIRSRLKVRVPGVAAEDEHLFIRDSTVLRRLRLDDVLLAEAKGDYVKVYTHQQTYCIHVRFGVVERRLPGTKFIRVHRSFIVALDKIDNFQDGGVFIEDRFVPVTETYRKALIDRILVI